MPELLHRELTEKIIGVYNGLSRTYPEFIYEKALTHDLTKQHNIQCSRQPEPELYYQVVGGLFEVHRELGPGYIHRIYANACSHEMRLRGLAQKPLYEFTVLYRAEPVGTVKFGPIQIEDKLMLFPVAVRETEQIEPENLRRWMKSQHLPLGILANFHTEPLELKFMRAD